MKGNDSMELLEYFDADNKKCMGIEERKIIHEKNLWHREVAVWVMNENKELLLQRRSPQKKQGANKFSVVAGHVEIKERETLGAIRELEEEIGLIIDENDLELIDIYKNEKEGNNCFSYTYLVKTNKKISDMVMQADEVSELKFISIEELENKIDNQDKELPLVKRPYIRMLLEEIKKRC